MTKAAEKPALTESQDKLTNGVHALITHAAGVAAELRSIATDTGNTDVAIRINALADKLDNDVRDATEALLAPAAADEIKAD